MCDQPGHDHHHHDHPAGPPPGAARVVVAGKGGVGKTTLTALLARHLARAGRPVVCVDGDEQANLAASLGVDDVGRAALVPVAEAGAYVAEKAGAAPGEGAGALLRLNPDVADAVDRLGLVGPDGVRLLAMGSVGRAGGGCLCPETSVLAAVLASMALRRDEVVLLDTHAGVEHFGRSLARGFDQALVVTDPTRNALEVAVRTAALAADLGVARRHLVVNRVRHPGQAEAVRAEAAARGQTFASVTAVPFDAAALDPAPDPLALLARPGLGAAVAALGGLVTAEPVGARP